MINLDGIAKLSEPQIAAAATLTASAIVAFMKAYKFAMKRKLESIPAERGCASKSSVTRLAKRVAHLEDLERLRTSGALLRSKSPVK